MEARSFNANDLQEGGRAFSEAAAARQEQKPILLEAELSEFAAMKRRAVPNYQRYDRCSDGRGADGLDSNNLSAWGLTQGELDNKMDQFKSEVDEAFHVALALSGPTYDAQESLKDLYAPAVEPHWTGEPAQEMRRSTPFTMHWAWRWKSGRNWSTWGKILVPMAVYSRPPRATPRNSARTVYAIRRL